MPSERANLVLADDHLSSAVAFGMALERHAPVNLLACHAHAGGAVAQVQSHAVEAQLPRIDLVLLDIQMPGLDPFLALKRIKLADSRVRVAFRSGHPTDSYIDRALAEKADGFLTKDEDLISTEFGVRAILAGEAYFSPPVQERIDRGGPGPRTRLSTLTERELEALRHFVSGRTRQEIAREMELSPRSVSSYLSRASDKLQVRGAVNLVRFAYAEGLVV